MMAEYEIFLWVSAPFDKSFDVEHLIFSEDAVFFSSYLLGKYFKTRSS